MRRRTVPILNSLGGFLEKGYSLTDNSLDLKKAITTLFYGLATIVKASIAGLLGSLISGAVFGLIAGIVLETFYFTSDGMSLGSFSLAYSWSAIITVSIPFGILIGFVTSFHSVIFSLFKINSVFWATITCLSAVAGLWFSSWNAPSLFQGIVFYLEIAIVSFTTGWSAHRYVTFRYQDERKTVMGTFLIAAGSISSAIVISSAYNLFFAFLEYLQNIPS